MIKKIFLSAAIMSALSIPTFAATVNNSEKVNKTRTECCKHKEMNCEKGMKEKCDRGMKAFEGINLTDAQKAKLENLRKETQAKREAEMKKAREMKESGKELTSEQKAQLKSEMKAKREQSKQEFLNNLKSILTPEQYTQFLENNFKADKHHGKAMKKGGMNKKASKDKKGNKAFRNHDGKKNATAARKGERNRSNGRQHA